MKHAGLLVTALAATMTCSSVVSALACEHSKTTQASQASAAAAAKSAVCTAEMAAACTAEQRAACKVHNTVAMTADHAKSCAAKSATAVTAEYGKSCGAKGAAAMTADHGKSCGAKGAAAMTADHGKSCGAKGARGGKVSAVAVGGPHCGGQGMAKAAGKFAHGDCDACTDMSACGDELDAAGAHTQAVRLKNGVMFVHTADSPGQVSAVQAAMSRRGDRMAQFVSAGNKARLCGECKTMRGAMANGKMNREVVNIEGGSLTLMTSTDPAMVAKIHAMVDFKGNARTKS